MRALVLFGLFCIFPALFCYTPETAEELAGDDVNSLDIAGEADVEVEASDPGLDSYSDALDIFLRGTRHCPHCSGCHCYTHGCVCRKSEVRIYLAYMDACRCRPCFSAIFHIGASFIFGECIPVTNGCHIVCKKRFGRTYCFKFCTEKHGDKIDGEISQQQPYPMYVGHFTLNL